MKRTRRVRTQSNTPQYRRCDQPGLSRTYQLPDRAEQWPTAPLLAIRRRANRQISVQPRFEKYSAFAIAKITSIESPVSLSDGRLVIVTDVGRDAVDATAASARKWSRRAGPYRACERSSGTQTNGAGRGQQNRVVLTPRRWRQVRGGFVGPTGQ
jgi:hypothetical protein